VQELDRDRSARDHVLGPEHVPIPPPPMRSARRYLLSRTKPGVGFLNAIQPSSSEPKS
jgi:hypothetical protein